MKMTKIDTLSKNIKSNGKEGIFMKKFFLFGGTIASAALMVLTSCGNKVEPAAKTPETVANIVETSNTIEENYSAVLDKKVLSSEKKNLSGLVFDDIYVTETENGTYFYTTNVANKATDTITITPENIVVYNGENVLENLFGDIKIFKDEFITVNFETTKENFENLKIKISSSNKTIIFE